MPPVDGVIDGQQEESVSSGASSDSSVSTGQEGSGGASTGSESQASQGGAESQSGGDQGTTGAYNPDYKYKVADQEKELEEWVRPYLTDAEKEKKFKDLYTRVDAFEFQKTKREVAEQKAQTLAGEHGKLSNWVQGMMSLRDKGDFDEFFSKVRLDEKQVMQWMLNKLETQEKLKDLPPHLQQQYNERQEYKRRAQDLEESNLALQTQFQEHAVSVRRDELTRAISTPDVATLVSQYDQRAGAPGAFQRLVIRHGDAEFRESGGKRDLTPQQAVTEVLGLLGLQQNATQGASQAPKPNGLAGTTPRVVTQPSTAAIPNVGRGGTSTATTKKPKSIDDIRALARAAAAAAE